VVLSPFFSRGTQEDYPAPINPPCPPLEKGGECFSTETLG
jgi:hypothetical protein